MHMDGCSMIALPASCAVKQPIRLEYTPRKAGLCTQSCLHGVRQSKRQHTMCATMQVAEPSTRPLQNHFPVATHFTTAAGA